MAGLARAPVAFASLTVAALLVAGCSGAPDDGGAGLPDVQPTPVPKGYALVCPQGGVEEGAVCAGRLASLTESNQEPFSAVDPWRPGVMAIGVNAGHTVEGLRLAEGSQGMDMVRLDLFVSTDNGTTWTLRTMPYIPADPSTMEPVQSSVVGDPALAFTPDGTLHVSGIVTHSQVVGYSVFHISTPDLGESWSAPTLLSTGDDNDRNWMNRLADGTLLVPWQRVGSLSEVAWSTDDGATWRNQAEAQKATDCITVSEVVEWNGTPILACADSSQAAYSVQVFAFDVATGDLRPLASLAMDCVWPKLSVADDSLVLTAEGCPGIAYATSRDGGTTWSQVRPIEDLAGDPATGMLWQTGDPWGRLHVMLLGASGVTYQVFDGATSLLRETLVAPASAAPAQVPTVPPRTLAPAYGDHYYGISVATWGGLVAWTEESTVRYALVAPVW